MGYIYCAGSMYYNAFPIALMYWSGGASLTVPLPYLYDLCLPVSDISGRPALWSSAGEELLVPGLATQVGSVEPSQLLGIPSLCPPIRDSSTANILPSCTSLIFLLSTEKVA